MDAAGELTARSSASAARRAYVGRFAPSPTGPLHLGSLVAALASWADARAHGGVWLVRIEDVDTTRASREAERMILGQLAACGLASDGPILRQSERSAHYAVALARLEAQGLVFGCRCSRRMLAQAPINAWGEPIYPGTCAWFGLPLEAHAVRFAAPARGPTRFTDRRHGPVEQDVCAEVGPFVVRRADGCYSYQLAVLVDDADQGVTDVVRGDDLLMNTPRQIALAEALGFPIPRYLHLPLVRAADGQKLSKQTLARPIATDEALPALRAAWQHLGQIDPGRIDGIEAFLRFAAKHWETVRLPIAAASVGFPAISSLGPDSYNRSHVTTRTHDPARDRP
ncbi:MAG: tRNA glutamyl-Q(34) synthetase GluQRS [Casimicrobiaceae bacterium]